MTNNQSHSSRFTFHASLWIALAAALVGLYLGAARLAGVNGFPLDDAWIHQTYARNLGTRGEFAFIPGVPSTGSTAPLWTLLLAAGYVLRVPFLWWTHGLNIVFLGLSGFFMMRLARRLLPTSQWLPLLIGAAVVGEWHLVWAAASGMETVLFVWLSILLVEQFAAWGGDAPLSIPSPQKGKRIFPPSLTERGQREGRFAMLGLIGGLLTLTRPEGIGLAGLVGLALAVKLVAQWQSDEIEKRTVILRLAAFGAGVALPLIPYFAFNLITSGLIFPNTLYAKQREYAILLKDMPIWKRWLQVAGVQFVGGQSLLLPGAVWAVVMAFRRRQVVPMVAAGWWLAQLSLYAVRLPVTYQHGRYEMPTLPWLIFFGVWGTAALLKPNHRAAWARVLSRTAMVSVGAAMVAFALLGAQSYANDVTFIDTEMVKTARWLNENTAPDAVIAAHDIGAIGYFTARPLVDLAGLVTPEVIPIIRDECSLLSFARTQGAAYLVTFPSWYPHMTTLVTEVYRTNSVWAQTRRHDNMTVFKLTNE